MSSSTYTIDLFQKSILLLRINDSNGPSPVRWLLYVRIASTTSPLVKMPSTVEVSRFSDIGSVIRKNIKLSLESRDK